MTRKEEIQLKLKSVRRMLQEKGLDGVIIRRQPNFSWITAGGRGFIGLAGDAACGMILVTAEEMILAANNIEGPRLMAEELPEETAKLYVTDWWEDGEIATRLREMYGRLEEDANLESWFKNARVTLLPSEIARYRRLGAEAAKALEDVCRNASAGMTETEIAGRIASRLWAKGIEPITLLVAADDRSCHFRHYVPTQKPAREGFIASICARSGGLVVSATRIVGFDRGFAADYNRLVCVEGAAFAATRPGRTLGAVLCDIQNAYEKAGFPDEWKNHHQGGMTGYLAREYRADFTSGTTVCPNQAFAWNPSASGVKCEDTILVSPDGSIEILTPCSEDWPVIEVNGWKRPDILRR